MIDFSVKNATSVLNMLKYQKDDILTCPVICRKDEQFEKLNLDIYTDYTRAYDRDRATFVTTKTLNIKTDPDLQFVNAKKYFYELLDQHRNIYANNIYRCIYVSKIMKDFEKNDPRLNECNKITSLTHIIRNIPEYDEEIDRKPDYVTNGTLQHLHSFNYQYLWQYYNQKPESYIANVNNNKCKYSDEKVNVDKYKYIVIPKEIMKKFSKIEMYFDEVKNDLQYNEKTGFYKYTYEGVDIDILCSHVYMLLSGVQLADISQKCYQDGLCIYCGQQMLDYNAIVSDTLPVVVNVLIWSLIKSINGVNQLYTVFYTIYDEIYTIIKRSETLNQSATKNLIAASALIIYKLIRAMKDKVQWKAKELNNLTVKLSECFADIGWDTKIVEQLLVDNNIVPDMDQLALIVSNLIAQKEIVREEYDPMYILNKSGNEKLKEMYKKDGNILVLNKTYWEFLMKTWQFSYTWIGLKYQTDFKSMKIKFDKLSQTYGKNFFNIMCESYCPANFVHEFTNGICKHCGLKQNGDNNKEIYAKYSLKINEKYLDPPKCIEVKDHDNYSSVIKKIETMNENSLLDLLSISNYNDKLFMESLLKSNQDGNKTIRDFIASVLKMPKKSVPSTFVFYKKAFVYMIQEHIFDSEAIYNRIILFCNDNEFLLL